jgi:hypothetical protein
MDTEVGVSRTAVAAAATLAPLYFLVSMRVSPAHVPL